MAFASRPPTKPATMPGRPDIDQQWAVNTKLAPWSTERLLTEHTEQMPVAAITLYCGANGGRRSVVDTPVKKETAIKIPPATTPDQNGSMLKLGAFSDY